VDDAATWEEPVWTKPRLFGQALGVNMEKDLEKFRGWLMTRGRDEGTADSYVGETRRCLKTDAITDRLVDRSLAPKTRHRIAATLRSWATFTKDADLLLTLKDVRLPPAKRKSVRRPLEPKAWHDLIDAVRSTRRLRDAVRGVLLILCVRGLRVGDILRMQRPEVEQALRTGRLVIETKRGTMSDFSAKPLVEGLELLLGVRGWRRVRDAISPDAEAPDRAARKIVHRALRRVGKSVAIPAEELYPHRLRRTYSVEFLRAMAGDPEALQKLVAQMGWLNSATALEYTDFVRSEDLEEVDAKLRLR
jgi:hypothetical protein